MASSQAPDKKGKENGNSPYCAFKSDKHRLLALVSRDVRIVFCACVIIYAGAPYAPRFLQLIAKFGG